MEKLWLYQQENNYDTIFLQETDYIEGKPLVILNIGKTECLPTVRTKCEILKLVSQQQKNVFRDYLSGPDLELAWNEM